MTGPTPNVVRKQMIVESQSELVGTMVAQRVALFGPDGEPLTMDVAAPTMPMTGYVIAGSAAPLADTDTLVEALGKLEKNTAVKTAALIAITGYTIAGSAEALSTSDTINVALGKLEKRIALLEAA